MKRYIRNYVSFIDRINSMEEKQRRLIEYYVENGMDRDVAEMLVNYSFINSTNEEMENDEQSYDVQYEYIDLVYPPNSTPPTPSSA